MKKKISKMWMVIPALVILGAIIKQLVVTFIPLSESVEVIPGLFTLRYVRHYDVFHLNLYHGAEAWVMTIVTLFNLILIVLSSGKSNKAKKVMALVSTTVTMLVLIGISKYIPDGSTLVFISLIAALGTIYGLVPRVLEKWYIQLPWCVLIAGVLGNLIDMSLRGYVVDYLYLLPGTINYVYDLEDWLIYGGYVAFIIGIVVFGVRMIGKSAIETMKSNNEVALIRGISK